MGDQLISYILCFIPSLVVWWAVEGKRPRGLDLSISLSASMSNLFQLVGFFLPQTFVRGKVVTLFILLPFNKTFLFLCALLVSFWSLCFLFFSPAFYFLLISPSNRGFLSAASPLSFPLTAISPSLSSYVTFIKCV